MKLSGPVDPVADSNAVEGWPSVSNDLIVYYDDGNVSLYNFTTGQTIPVTNDGYSQESIRIHSHHIVWADESTGNYDVYLHDLLTITTYQLTTDTNDQKCTDLTTKRVVFDDWRNGDRDRFAYHALPKN